MSINSEIGIDWTVSKEEFLQNLCRQYKKILEGSEFTVSRNSTPREMNLNIYREGEKRRVCQIWPKTRDRRLEITINRDIVDIIKNDLILPEDLNVSKDPKSKRAYYKYCDFNTSIEMIEAIQKRFHR